MFRAIRKLCGGTTASPELNPEPINDPIHDSSQGPLGEPSPPKEPINRRKVSGERVACRCEFILPNPDPFKRAKMLVSARIVLNVRGCCIYPDQAMSMEELKSKIPKSSALDITQLVITGRDNQRFQLDTVSVRRVRPHTDKNGEGVILRFSNLSESQIDKLNQITSLYAEPV